MGIPRNTVNISTDKINVVEVISFGPRGPQGPAGSGGGGDDPRFRESLTNASIAGNNITFTRGDSSKFSLEILSSSFALTASYIDYDNIGNKPNFVDVEGNVEPYTLGVFIGSDNGLPENLPFDLPLDLVPSNTLKSFPGLTYDGVTFNVQGPIVAESLNVRSITFDEFTGSIDFNDITNVPGFVDTDGEIGPNQLAIFVDRVSGIPENLPFSLPLANSDGNPTLKALPGLTHDGTTFRVEGSSFLQDLTVENLTFNNLVSDIPWDKIVDAPSFVDAIGETRPNQIAIFDDYNAGLPENVPFDLPLDFNRPTLKSLPGLTYDGNTFTVLSGSISANILEVDVIKVNDREINVDNLVNVEEEAGAFQLAIFADTTDIPLPIELPFYLPVNDGNPTIKGYPGLKFQDDILILDGTFTSSFVNANTIDAGILSASNANINELYVSGTKLNPANLVNVEEEAALYQLAVFADTTDIPLPIELPFYLPVNDGNPTIKGYDGLTFNGTDLTVQADLTVSGTLSSEDFNITELSRDLTLTSDLNVNGVFRSKQFIEVTGSLFLSSSLIASNLDEKDTLESSDRVLVLDPNNNGIVKSTPQSSLPYANFTSTGIPLTHQLLMMTASGGGAVSRGVTNSSIVYSSTLGLQAVGIGDIADITAGTIIVTGNITSSGVFKAEDLIVGGDEVNFTNLPTSDPGISGRLFQTGSDAIGGSAGFQVVLISQG